MFITVDGFNRTGIPSKLWEIMKPYSRVDHVGGMAMLSLVILVLSNLVSNVPTGVDSTCLFRISISLCEIYSVVKHKSSIHLSLWCTAIDETDQDQYNLRSAESLTNFHL